MGAPRMSYTDTQTHRHTDTQTHRHTDTHEGTGTRDFYYRFEKNGIFRKWPLLTKIEYSEN